MYRINKLKAREQCLKTITQMIFMIKKLRMEVWRDNITRKKFGWYLFEFLAS